MVVTRITDYAANVGRLLPEQLKKQYGGFVRPITPPPPPPPPEQDFSWVTDGQKLDIPYASFDDLKEIPIFDDVYPSTPPFDSYAYYVFDPIAGIWQLLSTIRNPVVDLTLFSNSMVPDGDYTHFYVQMKQVGMWYGAPYSTTQTIHITPSVVLAADFSWVNKGQHNSILYHVLTDLEAVPFFDDSTGGTATAWQWFVEQIGFYDWAHPDSTLQNPYLDLRSTSVWGPMNIGEVTLKATIGGTVYTVARTITRTLD